MVPPLPRRLLLQSAERLKIVLSIDDAFHRGGTEAADQLVFEVYDANIETVCLHAGASEMGAETGPLERAPEVGFLGGVAETRQFEVEPLRAEQVQEASYGLRTSNRHNRDALGVKIPTPALGKRLDRDLVTGPFDEHDRTRVGAYGQRVCRCNTCVIVTAGGRSALRLVNFLVLAHVPYLHAHEPTRSRPRRGPNER